MLASASSRFSPWEWQPGRSRQLTDQPSSACSNGILYDTLSACTCLNASRPEPSSWRRGHAGREDQGPAAPPRCPGPPRQCPARALRLVLQLDRQLLAERRQPFPPPAGQGTGSGGQGLQGVLRSEHLIQQPAHRAWARSRWLVSAVP